MKHYKHTCTFPMINMFFVSYRSAKNALWSSSEDITASFTQCFVSSRKLIRNLECQIHYLSILNRDIYNISTHLLNNHADNSWNNNTHFQRPHVLMMVGKWLTAHGLSEYWAHTQARSCNLLGKLTWTMSLLISWNWYNQNWPQLCVFLSRNH